ncbi:unnamed protein product [Polarella glacialis]|uniref:Protochlorophyllide reductase n=1 Tax=Polarella glacialis TaxID=89957 RepID=A0A813G7A5_POLGL|nr:unnamed protein product [Polarella glacialis]
MATFLKLALAISVLAVFVAVSAPTLINGLFELLGGAMDTTVGAIQPVGQDVLTTRFRGKSALVVGATRGIGRGIAIQLAKAGADVQVVGRSDKGGAAVVELMTKLALSTNQVFRAHSHDLSTVKGCQGLTLELSKQGARFDFLIFTVGVWPDIRNPNTVDGVNKVFAVDVLGRFAVFDGVQPLLSKGARVLNVLASTTQMPGLPTFEAIKSIISGDSPPGLGGFGMLAVASVSADAFLQQAGIRYSGFRFVGTQPGIVATDVIRTSFPGWLADILQVVMGPFAQSEEQSGNVHLNILSSPNLERSPTSYVDHLYNARMTNKLAYDREFGAWLWSFLETVVEKHR